jgi:CubicO group peptidase (beta-lactamase class C family)
MRIGSENRKRRISILIITVLLIMTLFFLPKHVLRYFYWNYADLNDYKKFPSVEMKRSDYTFFFNEPESKYKFQIPEKFNPDNKWMNFEVFLEENKTVAFLVVRNDTMVYENYFAGYTDSSIIPSFSMSKPFISALVGIAIDEGKIQSTNMPITEFLPELTNQGFEKITIEDLLNMRSGIDYNEGYNNPLGHMAKFYYGTNLKEYLIKLNTKELSGRRYDYVSVNALLLSLIVEKATRMKINKYLEQKIWQPIGMESDASWSIDSEKNQTIKAFCCINAVTRDFARFGRLYLKKGNWQGRQIISEEWVTRSTSIINDSRDSQGYPYTYQWRVLENGAFFAKGILGQYIFVYPEKNLVFVRMGKDYADIDWADLCVELSKSL